MTESNLKCMCELDPRVLEKLSGLMTRVALVCWLRHAGHDAFHMKTEEASSIFRAILREPRSEQMRDRWLLSVSL